VPAPKSVVYLFSLLLIASTVGDVRGRPTEGNRASAQEAEEPVSARVITFGTVLKHFTCGHSQAATYVINDNDAWQSLWKATMSNTFPIPPAPEVDFSQHSIVAVYQGNQPSSGYDVSIQRAVRSGKKVKIVVREVIPEDSCPVMLVITQPFHIILTDRVIDPEQTTFKIKTRVTHCE